MQMRMRPSSAKRVYFIRHGQSVANARKTDTQSERDAVLTELGRKQASCWAAPAAWPWAAARRARLSRRTPKASHGVERSETPFAHLSGPGRTRRGVGSMACMCGLDFFFDFVQMPSHADLRRLVIIAAGVVPTPEGPATGIQHRPCRIIRPLPPTSPSTSCCRS